MAEPYRATQVIQSDGLITGNRIAEQLKRNVDDYIAAMQTTNTDYARLQAIYDTLVRAEEGFQEVRDIDGIGQYARDQYADPTYDVVAAGNAMLDEVQTTIAWMDTNTILDNRTLKPISEWRNSRTPIADEFPPAEIQPLINRLQGVSDAIV